MSKPVGKYSVREAVQRIYPILPLRFSLIKLHAMVAREICRPQVFCDTVRRKLDELREEGLISFENVDKKRSIYHKTDRQ
jgi:hypothetical protein